MMFNSILDTDKLGLVLSPTMSGSCNFGDGKPALGVPRSEL